MTQSAVVYTKLEGAEAGRDLGRNIAARLEGSPDAVVVFASPANDYSVLLRALHDACGPREMIGCSSAGEFTSAVAGEGMSCAIALRSTDMRFRAAIGRDLSQDPTAAAQALAAGFAGAQDDAFRHRAALVLVDALAGYTEELMDELTIATAGQYRFFGGGAGDDARFQHTHVFHGTNVHSNAVVALEILSNKRLGISARHGWQPASPALRVTQSESSRVVSLNVAPAVEAFAEHAARTQQSFDRSDPVPFFLHNIVGIKTPTGHKLRVPLGVADDGGIMCAAAVPTGATTHIMETVAESAISAAKLATEDAVQQVTSAGDTPQVALFFDCVATRLRMGREFQNELATVQEELGGAQFAGFNSYGQIVRAEGQFSGFHNCTAVVCVIPE